MHTPSIPRPAPLLDRALAAVSSLLVVLAPPQAARPGRPPRARVLCVLALLGLLCTGCVQRRLMIVSNPPGALVYVGNQEIGTTPVAVNFTYYGTRQVKLVLDGHETLTDRIWLRPPWYEVFPLEFVSENLVPVTIRDHRQITYNLQPQLIQSNDALIDRANQLRQSSGGNLPRSEYPPSELPTTAQTIPPGGPYPSLR